MLKKNLIVVMFMFFINITFCFSQNYNISNSTVSTCSGNFYDSNGAGGNYFNNENYVMTFCSSTSGDCVQLSFTALDLEDGFDFLTVYNGSTTAAPVLGTYTGNNIPGLLTATSGCLTIEFTSDFAGRADGWEASIACVPCPASNCPSCNGGAAPANDACSGAMNLGALPAPNACPNGVGAWANFNTTNICATAENPYSTLTGCQPTGNMASPAADVWYRFTITGPTLNINIAGMQTPNIGLYTGNNCNNLVGRGCAIGGGGILNTSFGGLAPGTYFLQVSGGNLNDQCAFTLSMQNNYDCAGCVIQSGLTASPPPVNGTYQASQTVTFCYTVTDYNQTSVNWLHGIVPTFGAGWDMSTLVTNPPVSCSGQGTWSWYNSNVTSTATGNVTGPGFYFESQLGNAGGVLDGNPGNNFGDNNPNNLCDWTFCWTITTLPPNQCTPGASLNITVDTYGDGESGSWTSLACVGDPVSDFFATLTCCASPQVSITNPACFGQNNGSVIGSGQGNAPWDYIWKNNAGTTIQTANNVNGTNTINNLAPGNYTLTCNDNAGCSATINFSIIAPVQIVANTVPVPATCNAGTNGSATVNVVGGAVPYQYLWAPLGGSGSNASGLSAGTYTVTVTDNNGCTTTAQAVITQPNPIVLNIVPVDANCGASNGSLTVNVVGGVGALQYSNNGGVSFQAGNVFSNLSSGNYNLVVQDASGCQGTAVGQVNNLSGPSITSAPPTSVPCHGGATGSIVVNTSGGTGVLQYSNDNGATFQASNTFNNLVAGNYSIIVEDANGCQATLNVVVTEPPVLAFTTANVIPTCGLSNGTITVNTTGGVNPMQYSINGGANQPSNVFANITGGNYTVTVTDANNCTASLAVPIVTDPPLVFNAIPHNSTCGNNDGYITVIAGGGDPAYSFSMNGGPGQGSGNFGSLFPGNYSVMVTDQDGCTLSLNVSVPDEPGPVVTSTQSTEVTCFGGLDGTITINVTGGTAPIQYSLNGGAFQTSNVFNNLYAGSYTITVRDANGCVTTVNVNIGEPAVVLAPWSALNSTCGFSNGSVTVNATGGTGTLMYSLNGGPFQLSNTFNNLSAGNYDITVIDGNGCVVVANTSVSNIPGPVIPSVNAVDVTCFGGSDGSLDITANGGAAPLQYSIDNGITYQATSVFSGLSAGNQTILVTDANGCTVAVNINIAEPALIVPVLNITGTTCGNVNGSVTITANGGTGAYQFSFDGGPFQAIGTYSNLAAGNYIFTIQDANNCSVNGNIAIVDAPGPVITNATSNSTLCNGSVNGSISVTAIGGTNPKQYEIVGGAVRPNGNFGGLPAGTYTVIVTDANGCTATIDVTVNEPPALVINAVTTGSTCGVANGSIVVNANGGTGVIQYSINNGAYQAGNTFSNLAPGNYTIKIKDDNGCNISSIVNISDAPSPVISNVPITNILCNGANTGTVTIVANGGTNPLDYSLNGGAPQASGVFVNLTAGAYAITVTDANGCTATSNVNLTEPSLLTANSVTTSSVCSGSNGSVIINASGATPGYQYSLGGGPNQGTNSFSGLLAGNYSATVVDANGCTAVANFTITDIPAPVITNSVVTDALCFDSDDGSIDITISGGTAPITYSLNGGPAQASGLFPGLVDGNYSVLVTDANGCTTSVNLVVNEPTEIVMATVITNSTCGNANGSIVINGNGGTGTLTYSLDSGPFQLSNTFSNLLSGNYNVTIHDANNCELKSSVFIPDEPGPTISSVPVVDALCNGSSDGSLNINAFGGTGVLTYSIDNGFTNQASNTFNNLSAGTYDIMITDANGCTSVSQAIIGEPAVLQLNSASTPSTCGNSNGEITMNAAGGIAPYEFSLNAGANQVSATFSNLLAGNYNITVTDDHGCTLSVPVTVSDLPAPTISSVPVVDTQCNGGNDGSLTINAIGGTGALTYSIDNGATSQPANTFNNLSAGTYDIVVTDANGCTVSIQAVVSEPTLITANDNTTPASCGNSDGTTTIVAAGGTPGYQFSIDNGTTYQPSGTFTNLLAGNYDITVMDANGCTITITTSINNTAAPVISSVNTTDLTCFNSDDGTIIINSNGGTAPLSFSIDNGTSFQALNNYSNLSPGNYSIIVEDALGCQATHNVTITEPTQLVIANQLTNTTCTQSNGSITINANGGTGSYSYSINGGTTQQSGNAFNNLAAGNYNIIVTDANGCTASSNEQITDAPGPLVQNIIETDVNCNGANDGQITISANGGTGGLQYSIDNGITFQASSTFSNLNPGNYAIVVTDANGCSITANASITEPAAISFTTASTPASCGNSDGTLTINANGGTGIYQFSIDNGVTYQAGNVFTNIPAGNYLIAILDANNCSFSGNGTVSNAAAPAISATAFTDVICFGDNNGTITITANGGTGALQFSIDNGTTFQAGNVFSNLAPGTYDIIVEDVNGCQDASVVTITEPVALSGVINNTTTTCSTNNGTLTIVASGGLGTYQYSINNGTTFQLSATFNNLLAGNYDVVIEDGNGCQVSYPINISDAPGPLVQSVNTSNVSCNGANDGTITINPLGGTLPLQYSIDNGISFQSVTNFDSLQPGTYDIIIEDANGCTVSNQVIITEPASINASFTSTDASCGNADGTLTINAAGGTGTLMYSIDNGVSFQSSVNFTSLLAGNYSIIIRDVNLCETTIVTSVNNAAAPSIQSTNYTAISCNGSNNGTITINASGGTGALTYSIDNGNTSQPTGIFTNLPPGIYNIVVADVNGCNATSQVSLTEPALLTATASSVTSTCGNSNGTITVNAQGGTGVLQYSNDGGTTFQSSATFTNLQQGPYSIQVTDANGCTFSLNSNVPNAAGPSMNIVIPTDITCNGFNDGSITIIANGGTMPLEYSINNGSTFVPNFIFGSLAPGNYNIVVSDANGCTTTSSAVLTQPISISFTTVNVDANCGNSDGSITITANGGAGNYSYSIDNGLTFQPSNIFTSLPAGTYTVLVRDGSDCTFATPVTLNNVSAPVISATPVTNVSCYGLNDGTISIAANGGVNPLSYSVDGGFTWFPSGQFNNMAPGTYNIIVSDVNGCDATSTATITQPDEITANTSSLDASCGNADGSVTINANGGTGSLTYALNGGASQAVGTFSNLLAGNYNIVVTDASGCSELFVASVSNTNAPVISSIIGTDITCFGAGNGAINISANGGNGTLSYSINNGTTYLSTNNFVNLSGGVYSVVVQDTNGCVATGNITIVEPDELILNTLAIAATCGNTNGEIQTLTTGGTGTIQYSINNGISFQTSGIFTNLAQGSYSIIISDANGCSASSSSNVNNIPGPLVDSISTLNSTCFNSDNGSVNIQLTGGTGPFQYSVNGGTTNQMISYFGNLAPGTYSIVVTDANGCTVDSSAQISEPLAVSVAIATTNSTCSDANATITVTGSGGTGSFDYSSDGGFTYQASNSFSNLLAGNYTVVVQDANGCTGSNNAVISDAPAPTVQTITPEDASCFGADNGTILVTAAGGTLPLQYSIDNGITFQSSNNFNNLSPGVYTILITDANGCSANSTGTILEPAAILLSTSSTSTLCFGSSDGSASVNVLGGISPYTYNWSSGAGSQQANNLAAGTYTVIVTDANGCTESLSAAVAEPAAIATQEQLTNITCNGLTNGAILLNTSGGTSPFTYNWSLTGLAGHEITNLAAGTYSVTINDANGCTYTQSYTIIEPSALTVTSSNISTLCFGSSNGSATVNATGGTAPYTYLWSNNSVSSTATSLPAGTYTLTVTDINGCSETTSETVSSPALLVATTTSTPVTCNGSGDGTAVANVTGGTAPYSYLWNNGATGSAISAINGGTFIVSVTDANNCIANSSVSVLEPAAMLVTVNGSATICIGQSTVISASAQGGNGGYQFIWSNGVSGSSQTVNPGITGSYIVTVTDSLGCSVTGNAVTVSVNPPLSLSISPADTICEGDQLNVSAIASGGNGGPYTFSWNGFSTTGPQINVSPASSTVYSVSVSDGCGTPSANASVQIVVNLLPVVSFTPLPAEGCAPLEVLFDNSTVTVSNGAFYQWYFGDNTSSNDFEPVHWYTEPGNYTVTLKAVSAEGCISELTVTDAVKVYPVPVAVIATSSTLASILNPVISFGDIGTGASWWNWDFGDNSGFASEQNIDHTYLETGNYNIILYVMNDYGCRDTAYSEIIIEGTSTVYIPNAFTPNGDGINDIFTVNGIGLDGMEMAIFNRWGNKVFSSGSLKDGWNGYDKYSGSKCQVGVYIYTVKVRNFKGEYQEFTGRVTLLD